MPEKLDNGLKENWREFKGFVEKMEIRYFAKTVYFVYKKDNSDEAYVFTSHMDLDEWLSKVFWEWDRYDTNNLEESMDDIFVWKLITESEFKKYPSMYKGAKRTNILLNGERSYRLLIPVLVEKTVNVWTNSY